MKISKVSIQRPVAVSMIILIVVLLGMVSLTQLNLDLYPNIEIPVAVVSTQYPGVGPAEVESMVTRPLERALSTVGGLEQLNSISAEGSSLIILQYDFAQDMEGAALDVREQIDRVSGFLPEDVSEPAVFKIDPNAMPIFFFSINSPEGIEQAQLIAEDKIQSRFERIPGVASVDLAGGFEKKVSITPDEEAMNGYGLTTDQLITSLRTHNINLPGGQITRGTKKLTLRFIGEYESVREIAGTVLRLPGGQLITLEDVAEVELVDDNRDAFARLNGRDSIQMTISKQSDANTVRVADAVNLELERIRAEVDGVEIVTIFDQSQYIKTAISNVATSGLIGGLLAVLILYLFLENVRTTLIIAISIPISVIATFFLMFNGNLTLNLMTLGGLSLGIGMLVDNAIVVLENIFRYRTLGYSREEAADKGTSEVAMAVTASTLTTVAVFLPIIYVEGVTSLIFTELALTVTFALLASLAVSLTVVPMLSSKLLHVDHEALEKKRFKYFERFYNRLESGYKWLLSKALKHKVTTILVALGIFVSSIGMVATLGSEFLPFMDEGRITVSITLPDGTILDETDQVTTQVIERLAPIEEVEDMFVTVGPGGNMIVSDSGSNNASIDILLVALSERERGVLAIADDIRQRVSDLPGVEIAVTATQTQGFGGMGGSPISIALKGDDLAILESISEDVMTLVKEVPGTREVTSDYRTTSEELTIHVRDDLAAQYGLTPLTVANAAKSRVQGTTAGTYKREGGEIDIVIESLDETQRIEDLKNIRIDSPMGVSLPLHYLADFTYQKGPDSIQRSNQVRTITVGSDLFDRDLGSVTVDIEEKLAAYPWPTGYSYDVGGQSEELAESFESLVLALIIAILLVYMVMAAQFESLLNPFLIIFSVPLAVSGGAIGLFLTGRYISLPALIGVIMLAGIVVNNGIVLVDYANTLRREKGLTVLEAIKEAGPTRLRPILMTTFTTVLGLFPLALGIGEGTEASAPLATVVIGGLLLSTLLTLVYTPVLYTVFNKERSS